MHSDVHVHCQVLVEGLSNDGFMARLMILRQHADEIATAACQTPAALLLIGPTYAASATRFKAVL